MKSSINKAAASIVASMAMAAASHAGDSLPMPVQDAYWPTHEMRETTLGDVYSSPCLFAAGCNPTPKGSCPINCTNVRGTCICPPPPERVQHKKHAPTLEYAEFHDAGLMGESRTHNGHPGFADRLLWR